MNFFFKICCIIFSFLFIGCKVSDVVSDSNLYSNAHNYILSNNIYEKNQIHVVDTLFYISQTIKFLKIKKPGNFQYNEFLLDSLVSLDEKNNFEKIYSKNLSSLELKSKKALFNLYFSKPKGNELNLEIVDNKENINNSHEFLTYFGVSYIYTFKFNKKGKIIFVEKMELINN